VSEVTKPLTPRNKSNKVDRSTVAKADKVTRLSKRQEGRHDRRHSSSIEMHRRVLDPEGPSELKRSEQIQQP